MDLTNMRHAYVSRHRGGSRISPSYEKSSRQFSQLSHSLHGNFEMKRLSVTPIVGFYQFQSQNWLQVSLMHSNRSNPSQFRVSQSSVDSVDCRKGLIRIGPPLNYGPYSLNEFMKVFVRNFRSELSVRASHAESCDFSISEIQYKSEHTVHVGTKTRCKMD